MKESKVLMRIFPEKSQFGDKKSVRVIFFDKNQEQMLSVILGENSSIVYADIFSLLVHE